VTAATSRVIHGDRVGKDVATAPADHTLEALAPAEGRIIAAAGIIARGGPSSMARAIPDDGPSGPAEAWSVLRRNRFESAADGSADPGIPSALFLHRRGRQGRADTAIRRMHDPTITPAKNASALAYITNHARALIDGLINAVEAHDYTTNDNTTADYAVDAVKAGAPPADATVPNLAAAKTLLQQTLAGNAPAAPQPDAILGLVIRALNYAEHEAATQLALARDVKDVLIGTEFSFGDQRPRTDEKSSSHLRTEVPEAGANEDDKEKAERLRKYNTPRTHATDVIAEWAKAARTSADKIPGNPTVTVANEQGKAGFPGAKKISYRWDNARPPWEWYWVADIDEACYETQTKPTSVRDLDKPEIKAIISTHIFGCAGAVKLAMQPKAEGLKPDPTVTGGGGHISFDVTTAFSGAGGAVSAELVMGTLELLQQKADSLSAAFRKDEKGKALQQPRDNNLPGTEDVPADVKNAPSLAMQAFDANKVATKTPGLTMKQGTKPMGYYSQLIKSKTTSALRGAPVDLANIQAALTKLNTLLTNTMTQPGAEKSHLEDDDSISHYQAINIEHLHDPTADKRRIEIRDIPAQTDHAKLMRDLKELTAVLSEAKDIIRLEQRSRLYGAAT
jgi:hypothetical protein